MNAGIVFISATGAYRDNMTIGVPSINAYSGGKNAGNNSTN